MKKTAEDIIILHICNKNMNTWYIVPEIWCALNECTDGQTDRKSEKLLSLTLNLVADLWLLIDHANGFLKYEKYLPTLPCPLSNLLLIPQFCHIFDAFTYLRGAPILKADQNLCEIFQIDWYQTAMFPVLLS